MSVGDTQSSESHPLLVSARHKDAVERAMSALQMSLRSLEEERGGEFICVDLRNSIDSLGEIIGVVTTDDILANIFSKFCVGK
jgi:tRNA modification GTPase